MQNFLLGVGEAAFAPTDIAGCVLWLRSDLGVSLSAVDAGRICTFSIEDGGSGYQVNDEVTFAGGLATATVSSIDLDGAITGLSLIESHSYGYGEDSVVDLTGGSGSDGLANIIEVTQSVDGAWADQSGNMNDLSVSVGTHSKPPQYSFLHGINGLPGIFINQPPKDSPIGKRNFQLNRTLVDYFINKTKDEDVPITMFVLDKVVGIDDEVGSYICVERASGSQSTTHIGISPDKLYFQKSATKKPTNSITHFSDGNTTDSITHFSDNGEGGTTVTTPTHNLMEDQDVTILDTTNYDGDYNVANVTLTSFDIDVEFIEDDATGTWETSGITTITTPNTDDLPEGEAITITGTTHYNGSSYGATHVTSTSFEINKVFSVDDATGTWKANNLRFDEKIISDIGETFTIGAYSVKTIFTENGGKTCGAKDNTTLLTSGNDIDVTSYEDPSNINWCGYFGACQKIGYLLESAVVEIILYAAELSSIDQTRVYNYLKNRGGL